MSRASGAGEAQPVSHQAHARGHHRLGHEGRAAPDLKAVGGQLLTLTSQGAHLLGRPRPWGPGTIHQLPLQRFLKPHLWPQQQPLRLGWPVLWGSSRAPSFHPIAPTAHQGQGQVQPGQPNKETESCLPPPPPGPCPSPAPATWPGHKHAGPQAPFPAGRGSSRGACRSEEGVIPGSSNEFKNSQAG